MGDVGVWRMSEEENLEVGDISQSDISQSRKTGLLYLQDPVNTEVSWPNAFSISNLTFQLLL